MAMNNNVVEATRLLVRSGARVYYAALPPAAKAAVRADFFSLDTQGEGHVSLQDFLAVAVDGGPSQRGLFRFLDADGSGFLELDEFITMQYMNDAGIPGCDACGSPILTGGYSCKDCTAMAANFSICLACYAPSNPAFSHHHPRSSFAMMVGGGQNKQSPVPPPAPACAKCLANESNKRTETAREYKLKPPRILTYDCDCCEAFQAYKDRYSCKQCAFRTNICVYCYAAPLPKYSHNHPRSSFILVENDKDSDSDSDSNSNWADSEEPSNATNQAASTTSRGITAYSSRASNNKQGAPARGTSTSTTSDGIAAQSAAMDASMANLALMNQSTYLKYATYKSMINGAKCLANLV